MKKHSATLLLLCCAFAAFAQTSTPLETTMPLQAAGTKAPALPALDKSPMDMAYFPADYPMLKTQNKITGAPIARIVYSRPQRDGRTIFGELIEYDKVWRLGANEATEIEFFKDITSGGKKIPKGRYTLYAIPTDTAWTIIINKETDTWGAFVYDAKKDLTRISVPVQKLAVPVEAFSMSFAKTDKGAGLTIAWEQMSVTLPFEFK